LTNTPGNYESKGLLVLSLMSKKHSKRIIGISISQVASDIDIGQGQGATHLVEMLEINFVPLRGVNHVEQLSIECPDILL